MAVIKCPRCGELKEVTMQPNIWVCRQVTPTQVGKLRLCEQCEMDLERFMKNQKGD